MIHISFIFHIIYVHTSIFPVCLSILSYFLTAVFVIIRQFVWHGNMPGVTTKTPQLSIIFIYLSDYRPVSVL